MTNKVLYHELLPHELIERVNDCPIAYLPVGTLEWHGLHLPYGVDMLVPLEVFKRLAARVGGVVLPPLFLGPDIEEEHDGTLYYGMDIHSFEKEHQQHLIGNAYHIPEGLYIRLLDSIFKNLKRNGFAALIGHGHGPSSKALFKCKKRFEKKYGIFTTNLNKIGKDILIDHAAANETSLMMALYGDLADLSRLAADKPAVGVWGVDPRDSASSNEGERILAENEELAVAFLLKLKETLPRPELELHFSHVKDLGK